MKIAIKSQTELEKGHTDYSRKEHQTLLVVFAFLWYKNTPKL